MEQEKKYVGSWWMWIMTLVVVSMIVLGGLKWFGLIGTTVAERVIFENSMQYTEARKQEIATYEAQLSEINRQLAYTDLEPSMRTYLETQAATMRVQLAAARNRQ